LYSRGTTGIYGPASTMHNYKLTMPSALPLPHQNSMSHTGIKRTRTYAIR